MTPDPDARCVVTRSAVRGTSPSPGAYEVVKISTTAVPTTRAVASSELLRSAEGTAARAGVCPGAADAFSASVTKATAQMITFCLFLDIGISSSPDAGAPAVVRQAHHERSCIDTPRASH